MASTYDTNPRNTVVSSGNTELAVTAPLDRVRWASVLAGIFTALATFIVLTVLGLALGLSSLDANNLRGFALGTGIFAAITALIAFFLGGFISAKTAAVAGSSNGLLNGAMVWIVTIPLLVNVLGAGIGSILGTTVDLTTRAADVASQAVAPAAAEAVSQAADAAEANPEAAATAVDAAGDAAANAANQAATAVAPIAEAVGNIDAEDVEQTVQEDIAPIAWATLLTLGLSALAAIFGGIAGQRTTPTEIAVSNANTRR